MAKIRNNTQNRFFSTKIKDLVHRGLIRKKYKYEFLNKMTHKQYVVFMGELKKQAKNIGIKISKNIHKYNLFLKQIKHQRK